MSFKKAGKREIRYERVCVFGSTETNEMRLNAYGEIVQNEWHQTGLKRPEIGLDEFVIMPNHMHGIIQISNPVADIGSCRDVARNVTTFRRER